MNTGDFPYECDSTKFNGYLAYDETVGLQDKRPGILIFHEAWGLNRHAIERADMLAEAGYIALAADLYGDRLQANSVDEAQAIIGKLLSDPALFRARLRKTLEVLAALPQVDPTRLAAIGYCLGGLAVLELVRDGAAITGGVTFHGSLKPTIPGVADTNTRLLICTGAEDPVCPDADILAFKEEMGNAKVDFQIVIYSDTQHSFTNPYADSSRMPGMAYNPRTDRRSWNAMKAFFAEIFDR